MPNTCKHPMTSVVSARTIKVKGKEFIEQQCACVDCGAICETNLI